MKNANTASGRYLTLTPANNGLEISLDKQGRQEIIDMREDDKGDDDIMSELFEDIQGNSEYNYHYDMGRAGFGMTEAPGITDGYHLSDDSYGEFTTDYPESAKVYWYEPYQVYSFIDKLMENGKVFFQEAKAMARGGKTADEYVVSELSIQTGIQKSAIQKWLDKNNLSKEDGLRILTGLGRKHIFPGDVAAAISGNENNDLSINLVEYVKSDKAYAMEKGGQVGKDAIYSKDYHSWFKMDNGSLQFKSDYAGRGARDLAFYDDVEWETVNKKNAPLVSEQHIKVIKERLREMIDRVESEENELKKYTSIPEYSGEKGEMGNPTDTAQMDKWINENIEKVDDDRYFTFGMKAKHLRGLYYEKNKLGAYAFSKTASGEERMESGGQIAFTNSNLYIKGRGLDRSGNYTIKVGFPNDRAFAIQTNGVLNETQNILRKYDKISEIPKAELKIISNEVNDYVKNYGSKNQKARLKIYGSHMEAGGKAGKELVDGLKKIKSITNKADLTTDDQLDYIRDIAQHLLKSEIQSKDIRDGLKKIKETTDKIDLTTDDQLDYIRDISTHLLGSMEKGGMTTESENGFSVIYTNKGVTYTIEADTSDQAELINDALMDYKEKNITKAQLQNTLQSYSSDEDEVIEPSGAQVGRKYYSGFYEKEIPILYKVNLDDKNRKEVGGLVVKNSSDLEEVAKYMTKAVKSHNWDLKDLIHHFETDNNFDYKVRVKIWDEMNAYEMPKTYDNILELLKQIVQGNGRQLSSTSSMEVGGKTPGQKLFLCQEGAEKFYVKANSMDEARDKAVIFNAVVISEVPMSSMGKKPGRMESGGKAAKSRKLHYVKIDGKYYVADDEPTTSSKDKAYSYPSKLAATRDAELIKQQWDVDNREVKVTTRAVGGKTGRKKVPAHHETGGDRLVSLKEDGKQKIGIDWQSDFGKHKDNIEEDVWNRIADMVKEGYKQGELQGEEPDFSGWWTVSIEEDENDEDMRNEEVARKIREGYTSGYAPNFTWSANVWNRKESGGSVGLSFSIAHIEMQRRRYVLIDDRTGERWANEFFRTEQDAMDFARQNKIALSDKKEKGGKTGKTEDAYEDYLNEMGSIYDMESDEWIIGGKNRYAAFQGNYGAALRKHDPIAFEVGYGEWKRGYAKGGKILTHKKGDLVFARNEGSNGLVGLVMSNKKKEDGEDGYDVYFRGLSGSILFMPELEVEDILDQHMSVAEDKGDLMHYPNIAKKLGIKLNPDYQERIDNPEEFAKGGKISEDRIDEATKHYAIAGLWSSSNISNEDEEFLDQNYDLPDIASDTMDSFRRDVKKFYEENIDAINKSGLSDEQIGHDFWLTKNHHGAGFFDRGLDDDVEKALEEGADKFKENLLVIGDDKKIHDDYRGGKKDMGGILIATAIGAIAGAFGGYAYRDNISSARENTLKRAIQKKQDAIASLERRKASIRAYKENIKGKAISQIQRLEEGGSMATGGGLKNRQGIFEITVPRGKESLLSDDNEYEFTSLISHTLTKKWFGHGPFDVRLFKKISDRTSAFSITVPRGKESLLSDDNEYDFTEFISKTLTKKWFGHGSFNVRLQTKSSGGSMATGSGINKKINVSFYKWGEYQNDEEIDSKDLPEYILSSDELDGFNIREEDAGKTFHAEENDVDTDDDGTSVKRAFAINSEMRKGGGIKNVFNVSKVKTPVSDSRANSGKERNATEKEITDWLSGKEEATDDEKFYDEHGNFVFYDDLSGKKVIFNGKEYNITSMATGGGVKLKSKKSANKKKAATDLLISNIKYHWRNTDMGSGYEFTLYAPFGTGRFHGFGDVLEKHSYLDMYDGDDDYSFEDWKRNMFDNSFDDFKEKTIPKYLHFFEEHLQRDSDYASGGSMATGGVQKEFDELKKKYYEDEHFSNKSHERFRELLAKLNPHEARLRKFEVEENADAPNYVRAIKWAKEHGYYLSKDTSYNGYIYLSKYICDGDSRIELQVYDDIKKKSEPNFDIYDRDANFGDKIMDETTYSYRSYRSQADWGVRDLDELFALALRKEKELEKECSVKSSGGSMATGGGVGEIYAVDIDLENDEQLRGEEYEFKTLDKAKKFYDEVVGKNEYNGSKLDNVQLMKVVNGNYETLESYFSESMAKGGGIKEMKEVEKIKNQVFKTWKYDPHPDWKLIKDNGRWDIRAMVMSIAYSYVPSDLPKQWFDRNHKLKEDKEQIVIGWAKEFSKSNPSEKFKMEQEARDSEKMDVTRFRNKYSNEIENLRDNLIYKKYSRKTLDRMNDDREDEVYDEYEKKAIKQLSEKKGIKLTGIDHYSSGGSMATGGEVVNKVYYSLSDLLHDHIDIDSIDSYDKLEQLFDDKGKIRITDGTIWAYDSDGVQHDKWNGMELEIKEKVYGSKYSGGSMAIGGKVGVHTPATTAKYLKTLNEKANVKFVDNSWHNDASDSAFSEENDLGVYFPNADKIDPEDEESFVTFQLVVNQTEANGKEIQYITFNTIDELIADINKRFPKKNEKGSKVESEGVDLFEDYKNIPANVQMILDKYSEGFEDGDYKVLEKALKEMEKIGYTFEYYLDGQAYDLRKIGQKGKLDEMAKGGKIKNQYLNPKSSPYFLRTPKDIWTSWNRSQRDHFIEDHKDRINLKYDRNNNVNLPELGYEELPALLHNQISFHIQSGEYAKGGNIGKKIVSVSVDGGIASVDKCPKGVDCYIVDGDMIKDGYEFEYGGAYYTDTTKLLKKMKSDYKKSGKKYSIVTVYGGVAYDYASSNGIKVVIRDFDNEEDEMTKGGKTSNGKVETKNKHMKQGGNISAAKKKLLDDIKTLQDAIDNSLLDDATKSKIPAKIEAKKKKVAEIDEEERIQAEKERIQEEKEAAEKAAEKAEKDQLARKEQIRREAVEREKKLRSQSLKNKNIYIDIDKQLKEKMRNAIHTEGIPYGSKTEGNVFRVFLSNQYQLDIVTKLYNEKRGKYNMEPVSKEQVANIIKQRVGKLKFMPIKEKPNLKSKLSVEKKRNMKKVDMQRSGAKGKLGDESSEG